MNEWDQLQKYDPTLWVLKKKEDVREIEKMIRSDKNVMALWHKMRDYHEITYLHGINVCRSIIELGVYREYPTEKILTMAVAGLLLDIGYLDIPKSYLDAKSSLTVDQFKEIKKHPESGAKYAKEAGLSEEIQMFILNHHESPDGTGYPDGKRETQLTVEQMIVRIADMYQAMQEKRTYRTPKAECEAFEQVAYMSSQTEEYKAVTDLKIAHFLYSV